MTDALASAIFSSLHQLTRTPAMSSSRPWPAPRRLAPPIARTVPLILGKWPLGALVAVRGAQGLAEAMWAALQGANNRGGFFLKRLIPRYLRVLFAQPGPQGVAEVDQSNATLVPQSGAFHSIFLEEEWAHQKYYGWRQIESSRGLRLLRKRRFLFSRDLFLLSRGGEDRLAEILELDRPMSRFGYDVTIHDFDGLLPKPLEFGDWRFRLATPSERLLNTATFIIDLLRDEETLLMAMSSDYRYKIKKAPKLGVTVECYNRPSRVIVAAFVREFRAFALERGLKPISAKALEAMYAGGNAILFLARRNGAICGYLHVYMTNTTGIFMYSVNTSKKNDGVGQFLHWCAIRRLKQLGLHWYDLGGVTTKEPRDGIYNFKAKFGGLLVDLGCEWRGESVFVHRLRALLKS